MVLTNSKTDALNKRKMYIKYFTSSIHSEEVDLCHFSFFFFTYSAVTAFVFFISSETRLYKLLVVLRNFPCFCSLPGEAGIGGIGDSALTSPSIVSRTSVEPFTLSLVFLVSLLFLLPGIIRLRYVRTTVCYGGIRFPFAKISELFWYQTIVT